MKLYKTILNYLAITLLCWFCGFIHMRIVLGPSPDDVTGFFSFFNGLHDFVILFVGAIVGSVIAVIYIILDLAYLKKKFENHPQRFGIHLGIVMVLAVTVCVTHYLLEEVIDVI